VLRPERYAGMYGTVVRVITKDWYITDNTNIAAAFPASKFDVLRYADDSAPNNTIYALGEKNENEKNNEEEAKTKDDDKQENAKKDDGDHEMHSVQHPPKHSSFISDGNCGANAEIKNKGAQSEPRNPKDKNESDLIGATVRINKGRYKHMTGVITEKQSTCRLQLDTVPTPVAFEDVSFHVRAQVSGQDLHKCIGARAKVLRPERYAGMYGTVVRVITKDWYITDNTNIAAAFPASKFDVLRYADGSVPSDEMAAPGEKNENKKRKDGVEEDKADDDEKLADAEKVYGQCDLPPEQSCLMNGHDDGNANAEIDNKGTQPKSPNHGVSCVDNSSQAIVKEHWRKGQTGNSNEDAQSSNTVDEEVMCVQKEDSKPGQQCDSEERANSQSKTTNNQEEGAAEDFTESPKEDSKEIIDGQKGTDDNLGVHKEVELQQGKKKGDSKANADIQHEYLNESVVHNENGVPACTDVIAATKACPVLLPTVENVELAARLSAFDSFLFLADGHAGNKNDNSLNMKNKAVISHADEGSTIRSDNQYDGNNVSTDVAVSETKMFESTPIADQSSESNKPESSQSAEHARPMLSTADDDGKALSKVIIQLIQEKQKSLQWPAVQVLPGTKVLANEHKQQRQPMPLRVVPLEERIVRSVPGSREEGKELTERLSVFDDYLFLINQNDTGLCE